MAYGTLAAIADATKSFAIDLISGSIFSRVKMTFGLEGVATDVSATNPLPVSIVGGVASGLTDAQLRAAPVVITFTGAPAVSVSGAVAVTGAFFQATQPVSAVALPLPAGAATAAAQTTGNTSLASIDGKLTGPLTVNLTQVAGAAIAAGAGNVTAGTQRVVIASDQAPMTTVLSVAAVKTDRSGAVATGGTAQQIMAANPARKGWQLQNTSDTDLWFNALGAAAVAGGSSFKLPPNGFYEAPPHGISTAAVSVLGATAGKTFAAREW